MTMASWTRAYGRHGKGAHQNRKRGQQEEVEAPVLITNHGPGSQAISGKPWAATG